MARRSTSQFKIDDLAYPIRLKITVPVGGMRTLPVNPDTWLKENLDHLGWSWASAQGRTGQAIAYYFRHLADAQRFLDAHPQLELADGVGSVAYSSPSKEAGPGTGEPYPGHPIRNGWKG